MKKRGFGIVLGVAMLGLLAADARPASAAAPQACSTDTLQRVYNIGYRNGQSLLLRAWSRVNRCNKLKDFREIVRDSFAESATPSTSTMVACRMSGMYEGYYDAIAKIDNSCRTCVLQEDWAAAEYAAYSYCALGGTSIPVEQLTSGPRRVCGASARLECPRSFDQVVKNACADLVSTNPPDRFRSIACTVE